MILLAIDPGPTQSAWLTFDTRGKPVKFGIDTNEELLGSIRSSAAMPDDHRAMSLSPQRVVIEQVESFGMAVGAEVFETVFWSGRFAEAARPVPFDRVKRSAIKVALCGSVRAKDGNIRQALIDRYGGSAAKGTKAAPGPLYGVSNDVWSALAVAVTYADELAAGRRAA